MSDIVNDIVIDKLDQIIFLLQAQMDPEKEDKLAGVQKKLEAKVVSRNLSSLQDTVSNYPISDILSL